MFDLGTIISPWNDLAKKAKWVIITLLVFILSGVAVKMYLSSRLKQAQAHQEQAEKLKLIADLATKDAEKYKLQASRLQDALTKANTKLTKLQAAVDKVVVPPAPTQVPAVKDALNDLQKMGLELVFKPSVSVKPSVAGITADDTQKVWLWGQQAARVPMLELKIEKQDDLIKGLDKAKTLAESLAETKTAEAGAYELAAEKRQQEALALQDALTDTQKALKAERKMKVYYAVGAAVLTRFAVRR